MVEGVIFGSFACSYETSSCIKGSGLKVKQPCTPTSDTVCEPVEGFFCIDSTTSGCSAAQKHKSCDPGQYIREKGWSAWSSGVLPWLEISYRCNLIHTCCHDGLDGRCISAYYNTWEDLPNTGGCRPLMPSWPSPTIRTQTRMEQILPRTQLWVWSELKCCCCQGGAARIRHRGFKLWSDPRWAPESQEHQLGGAWLNKNCKGLRERTFSQDQNSGENRWKQEAFIFTFTVTCRRINPRYFYCVKK